MDSGEDVVIAVGSTFFQTKRGNNENRSEPRIFLSGEGGDDPEAIYNLILKVIIKIMS
jgi:hypothetical protein